MKIGEKCTLFFNDGSRYAEFPQDRFCRRFK